MNQQPIGNEEARNLKDFLLLRNSIADKCFRQCVVQLYSDNLTRREIHCIERCTERFAEGNQRVMLHFLEYSTQKQQAEMQRQGQTTLPGQSPTTAPT